MVSPKDAEPVARVWLEQLDRFDVHPALYSRLLDDAINHRLNFLNEGQQPPALTVELLLVMFKRHKNDTNQKVSSVTRKIENAEYTLDQGQNLLKPFTPDTRTMVNSRGHEIKPIPVELQHERHELKIKDFIHSASHNAKREISSLIEAIEFIQTRHAELLAERQQILTEAYL